MKHLLAIAALIVATHGSAQFMQAPEPISKPDLHLAGVHLERAGKQRGIAMASLAIGGLAAGAVYWTDKNSNGAAISVLGIGAAISIGFTIDAQTNEVKAGRILKTLER